MYHVNYDAFIEAINKAIEGGTSDFYLGYFAGTMGVVCSIAAFCILACAGSFVGWLLSRFAKPLFVKKKKPSGEEAK